jgi:peptidoglycan L-alanyl-D-glutamate endopeptidase CwlK
MNATHIERLVDVHPDLQRLVQAMGRYCPMPFMVYEGMRTEAKQAEYVAAGTSTTMNSRHLTGHAVDLIPLVNGQPTYDWSYYNAFSIHMFGASNLCAIPVHWGGDWKSFPDGAHWELPWEAYPAEPVHPPEFEEPVVA